MPTRRSATQDCSDCGGHVNVTDARSVFMRAPAGPENTPLYEYTLMPTHMSSRFSVGELQNIELAEPFPFTKGCPTLKIAGRPFVDAHVFGTMLFDLEQDPQQIESLIDDVREHHMLTLLSEQMGAADAPPEQYERLGFPASGAVGDEHLLLAAQRPLVVRSTSTHQMGDAASQ